ncbi:MAG: cytochrome c biogenesis protein CcdA [bacterium]
MILPDVAGLLATRPVVAIPLVFAGGLLTSLTPCIYPMIPITAAVVGGQSVSGSAPQAHSRTIALTGAYVLGLALAYAALGLFAGLTGSLFGGVSTNPWLYLFMGNLLILYALAMLDVLPVPVPRKLLARAANMDAKGRVAGAFAMGGASGLVAAPCGAPVFAAVLTWVAATGSATLGFIYLFTFSLGMSALLVVVGLASGGAMRLPRAGAWMVWVKRFFAAVLLGTAEYYLVHMGQLLV